jgi:hypothetical protein
MPSLHVIAIQPCARPGYGEQVLFETLAEYRMHTRHEVFLVPSLDVIRSAFACVRAMLTLLGACNAAHKIDYDAVPPTLDEYRRRGSAAIASTGRVRGISANTLRAEKTKNKIKADHVFITTLVQEVKDELMDEMRVALMDEMRVVSQRTVGASRLSAPVSTPAQSSLDEIVSSNTPVNNPVHVFLEEEIQRSGAVTDYVVRADLYCSFNSKCRDIQSDRRRHVKKGVFMTLLTQYCGSDCHKARHGGRFDVFTQWRMADSK